MRIPLVCFLTMIILLKSKIVQCQSAYPHFFAYHKGLANKEIEMEYGDFYLKDKKLKKQHITSDSIAWLDSIYRKIDELPDTKSGLIIYIHGFQGDNKFFVEESGFILQSEIFDQEEHKYGMALSLQWKTGLSYDESVKNALAKGAFFSDMVNNIYERFKKIKPLSKVTVICHSMGNRVWQGLYDNWIQINPDVQLENVFFLAADLEADVFNHHFMDLNKHCRNIYIYHSLMDRTLQMANAFKEHKRLGIVGPADPSSLTENFIIRNVTEIRDDETIAGKLSLHRYYYGSPTIRKEILAILAGDK